MPVLGEVYLHNIEKRDKVIKNFIINYMKLSDGKQLHITSLGQLFIKARILNSLALVPNEL